VCSSDLLVLASEDSSEEESPRLGKMRRCCDGSGDSQDVSLEADNMEGKRYGIHLQFCMYLNISEPLGDFPFEIQLIITLSHYSFQKGIFFIG
jgi:hypothetical protein